MCGVSFFFSRDDPSGRTTLNHPRIRSPYSEASCTSDGTNTTQVFFSQTLIDTPAGAVPPVTPQRLR
jgi:hypothetical protein